MSSNVMIHANRNDLSVEVVPYADYLTLALKVRRDGWQEDTVAIFLSEAQIVEVYAALATHPRVIEAAGPRYVERAVQTALSLAKVSHAIRDHLERGLRAMDDDEREVEEAGAVEEPTDTPDAGKDAWQLDAETLQAAGWGIAGVDF